MCAATRLGAHALEEAQAQGVGPGNGAAGHARRGGVALTKLYFVDGVYSTRYYFHETAQHGSFTGRLFRKFVPLNMLWVLQLHLIFQSPSGWLNDDASQNM